MYIHLVSSTKVDDFIWLEDRTDFSAGDLVLLILEQRQINLLASTSSHPCPSVHSAHIFISKNWIVFPSKDPRDNIKPTLHYQ